MSDQGIFGTVQENIPRPHAPSMALTSATNFIARLKIRFTTMVAGMTLLLFSLATIGFPATFFILNLQYLTGHVEAESEANAEFISLRLTEHPGLKISSPDIEYFVNEDMVFKGDDDLEGRAILLPDGQHLFTKRGAQALARPVLVKETPINVAGTMAGFFRVERSLAPVVHQTLALFVALLVASILITRFLNRFVLRGLREVEVDMARHAHFDSLTGLPNRNEVLKELRRRLIRNGLTSTAVIFINLNRFKAINDSFGRAIGDEVLKVSAARLRSHIRSGDFLGRLGGDEFIIILNLVEGVEQIRRISDSVTQAFDLPQVCLGREVELTATVGVAIAPEHGDEPEELIQYADTAMHTLKRQRSGGWKIYERNMTETIDREVRLRAKLKHALERQEFVLHYQPLVRLPHGQVIGAEALIRWCDPETGLLAQPQDFIPELEHSGLIVPVGQWILRVACQQAVQWRQTAPEFYVAVNVSARQFAEENFVATVAQILKEEGVSPNAIEIELTETMLLDEVLTTKRLAQLKEIGVRLSLDDFGTGFSSLGRLSSMPFDVIKIDRQFVNQMNVGERERSVVVSIVALGHVLGMTVLSEGIETTGQLQTLIELGCDRGQGFLFAKPVSAEIFTSGFIERNLA